MRILHSRRLKDLRLYLGMTQKEFAQRLGCSQPALSAAENGRKQIAELIEKAVFAFKVPPSYFEAPPSPYGSDSLNVRTKRISAKVRRAFSSTFYEAERAMLSAPAKVPVVNLANENLPNRAYSLPLSVIETVAAQARNQLGVSPTGPVFNVTHAIEKAGHRVCTLTNDFVDISDIDGASSPEFNHDGLGLIATTEKHDGGRVRFTRAHELGHLVMHSTFRPSDEKAREDEADFFAGAFLFPEEDAKEMLSESLTLEGYARIKSQYAVSIAALIHRGRDLGITSAERYHSLMIQLSSRGWRINEPVEVPVERATTINAISLRKESTTQGDLAALPTLF